MSKAKVLGEIPQADIKVQDRALPEKMDPVASGIVSVTHESLEKQVNTGMQEFTKQLPALDPDAVAEEAKKQRGIKRKRK